MVVFYVFYRGKNKVFYKWENKLLFLLFFILKKIMLGVGRGSVYEFIK